MTYRQLFWCCLTAASFAFLGGVVSGVWSSTASIGCRLNSQAEEKPKPPTGDQFDEGPTMARAPGTHLVPVRFIF